MFSYLLLVAFHLLLLAFDIIHQSLKVSNPTLYKPRQILHYSEAVGVRKNTLFI